MYYGALNIHYILTGKMQITQYGLIFKAILSSSIAPNIDLTGLYF